MSAAQAFEQFLHYGESEHVRVGVCAPKPSHIKEEMNDLFDAIASLFDERLS